MSNLHWTHFRSDDSKFKDKNVKLCLPSGSGAVVDDTVAMGSSAENRLKGMHLIP